MSNSLGINIILNDITFTFFFNYLLLVNGSFDIHPWSLFIFFSFAHGVYRLSVSLSVLACLSVG